MLTTIKTEEGLPEREEIEQVRRLLFGEMQEANRRRFEALEAGLQGLQANLEARIAALGTATSASQANVIREIGVAIAALGQQIAGLAGAQVAPTAPWTVAPIPPISPDLATTSVSTPASENAFGAATGAQDHE